MRNVIVHYHIFKNAGSTIDYILQRNYGEAWFAYEGDKATSKIFPDDLLAYLRSHPKLSAISSHHAVMPVPQAEDINIFPIVFLRHPLDRVRSVYDFERQQGLTHGPVSKGAEHASKLNFGDYIQWRFESTQNGVIHNLHTSLLLHHPRYNRLPIQQNDFEQALKTLEDLPFFGLVECFDESLKLLDVRLATLGIRMDMDYQIMNSGKHQGKPLEERLSVLHSAIGETAWAMLVERNQWDLKLYEAAQKEFQRRLDQITVHRGRGQQRSGMTSA